MTHTPFGLNIAVAASLVASSLGSVILPAAHPGKGHHRPGPGTNPGNLIVQVPAVPKHGRLRRLCEDLQTAEQGGPKAAKASSALARPEVPANSDGKVPGLQLLTGATGGNLSSTEAWCRAYLAPGPRGPRSA